MTTMLKSNCNIPTASASRYLQQLCKHWAAKFTVEFDPQQGRIETPDGWLLEMKADDAALHVTAGAADAETLTHWQDIIAKHISRFGFREELTYDWQPAEN